MSLFEGIEKRNLSAKGSIGFVLFAVVVFANRADGQTAACCLGTGACVDTNSAGCDVLKGELLGEGTSCASAVCTGACCLADEQCSQGAANDCGAGDYRGAGSLCETHCPGPLGTGFTYQGHLMQDGAPMTGTVDLEASLWNAGVGGELLGDVLTRSQVDVTDGLFSMTLDFGADAFNGSSRFLQLAVRSPHDPSNTAPLVPLSPRQQITLSPNALFATNAAAATTASTANDSTMLNGQPAAFYQDAANLNAGALADARLSGNVALLNAAQTFSAGKTFSAAPAFTAAGSPFSVTNTNQVANLNADFLDGLNSSAFLQSVPVPLTLSGTSATNIIRGDNASTIAGATGVRGMATGATGVTHGGRFESASTSGIGVYGLASVSTSTNMTYGVYGFSDSNNGGRGVYGQVGALNGTGYGVYGFAFISGAGIAVYAQGDFTATGTKAFRIDHPDDPANKYLLHYAAESPEVINFYRDTVLLDGAGEAVVELPHYFAKINKTPSYVLTAVGAPMPMLHVSEEIDEAALSAGAKAGPDESAPVCSFRIAGGVPGAKVCWRVEALRNDRWVRTRGAPVEVEKQDIERGTYQHPELYGQPPEKGMNYDGERKQASPP